MCACVQHLWSAAKHYKEALKADKGNIYAANGLGAVCATMGQMDAARHIFNLLRESAATLAGFVRLPDVRPARHCASQRDGPTGNTWRVPHRVHVTFASDLSSTAW